MGREVATPARRGGGPDLMGNIELEYIIGINGVIVIGIHKAANYNIHVTISALRGGGVIV